MPFRIWRKPLDEEKIKITKGEVHIIKDRCKGCEFCIEFCPRDVLEVSKEFNIKGIHPPIVKDETRCTFCGYCEIICPEFAIFVIEKEKDVEKEKGAIKVETV